MKSAVPMPIQRVDAAFSFKREYQYSEGYIELNRFKANDFKSQNRHEKKDEFITLFSQMCKQM